jgi:hypothetical protein
MAPIGQNFKLFRWPGSLTRKRLDKASANLGIWNHHGPD